MAAYLKDIWIGVTTVLTGMKVTFMHLFDPAITIQYPHEKLEMNDRTRARLVNYEVDCSVCLACQRACPVNIFKIKGVRADKDEDLGMLTTGKPKRMHLVQFEIDFAKCVYCGLCVDACDTKSLRWEIPQEESTFTREEMYKSFVTMPQAEIDRLLALEEERKKARAAAPPAGKGKPPVRPGGKPPVKTTAGDKPDQPKPAVSIQDSSDNAAEVNKESISPTPPDDSGAGESANKRESGVKPAK